MLGRQLMLAQPKPRSQFFFNLLTDRRLESSRTGGTWHTIFTHSESLKILCRSRHLLRVLLQQHACSVHRKRRPRPIVPLKGCYHQFAGKIIPQGPTNQLPDLLVAQPFTCGYLVRYIVPMPFPSRQQGILVDPSRRHLLPIMRLLLFLLKRLLASSAILQKRPQETTRVRSGTFPTLPLGNCNSCLHYRCSVFSN